jgi:hypothetical protein
VSAKIRKVKTLSRAGWIRPHGIRRLGRRTSIARNNIRA